MNSNNLCLAGLEEDRVSSFIKGRLLALSLIKEPDVSFGMRYDLNVRLIIFSFEVYECCFLLALNDISRLQGCKSATSMATEAIGPIGLDLEVYVIPPLFQTVKIGNIQSWVHEF